MDETCSTKVNKCVGNKTFDKYKLEKTRQGEIRKGNCSDSIADVSFRCFVLGGDKECETNWLEEKRLRRTLSLR